MIATGKWAKGDKLPSIREGERQWQVNRLTVQKAYRMLVDMGLVTRKRKSGFYVAEQESVRRISRHRYELDRLYDEIHKQIVDRTDLSPISVFRYLANIAEIRTREQPECAFIECTAYQAGNHAREISERLNVPVMALTTEEIDGRLTRIPPHITTLFTTAFHFDELVPMQDQSDLRVYSVTIEVSPELVDELNSDVTKVTFLEMEEVQAKQMARDAFELFGDLEFGIEVVKSVEAAHNFLANNLDTDSKEQTIFLSPRIWGSVDPEWHEHNRVRPVIVRIAASAWPAVVDAIGLPFGDTC
jgi:DNA-binding transcriptional regulator YhcF (GntR family)